MMSAAKPTAPHPPFISREDAATEISRILVQREGEYPKLVADGRLSEAEATLRTERLEAAILYVLQPALLATTAASYRNTWKLAEELLRERSAASGRDQAQPSRGGRR